MGFLAGGVSACGPNARLETDANRAVLSPSAEEIYRILAEMSPEQKELANYLNFYTNRFNRERIFKWLGSEEQN